MRGPKEEPNLKFVKGINGKPDHYVTAITLGYRQVRRAAGYTKEEARNYLLELRLAYKEGRLREFLRPAKPLPGRTFGEYARALLDSAEWKQKRSHRRDETSLDALNKVFKDVPLDEIKPGVVRAYMTKRTKDDGRRPATANRELTLLKSVLYAAEFDEIIEANPIRGRRVKRLLENNKREKAILTLGLTDEDFRRLVAAGGEWFGVVLRLAVTLGMRLSEILKAKWKHFNLPLRTLYVPEEDAKNKEGRTVPLDPELAIAVDSLPRIGQYIFSLPNGERRRDVRKPWLAACEAAGIPTTRKKGICFHDLRHFAAYRLLKHTDVITVMRIMGWKSLSMVERYIHPTDEGKRLAVEAASADLFPVQGRQNYVNAQDGQHEEQPAELAEIKRVQ